MDQLSSSSPTLSFEARAAGRLAVSFLLDIAAIGRQDDRLIDALLVGAIIHANISPLLRDPTMDIAYAREDTPPPDELRRPVSVNALATSLRLPFETVRRHVKKLVAEGLCTMTPQGLYVPAYVLGSPQFAATSRARYARVFQLYDELRAVNAIEPLPYRPLPVDDPRAPIRSVGRILSDFFFRTIDMLQSEAPDPLTGLVLLEVTRSSSEHLSATQAETAMRAGWIANHLRAPVRVAHIARRLDMPYETMRRHVGWLVDHGYCERAGGGVVTTEAYMMRPQLRVVTANSYANLQRMFRQLAHLPVAKDEPGTAA